MTSKLGKLLYGEARQLALFRFLLPILLLLLFLLRQQAHSFCNLILHLCILLQLLRPQECGFRFGSPIFPSAQAAVPRMTGRGSLASRRDR